MAAESKTVIYAALVGNAVIAATKFVAAFLTGSSAMLAEGIHSVVDTGNQILMLLGLRRARRPADERFPFGHGKEVYFWSFVVALSIFAVGAGVSLYEGIHHILHPGKLGDPTINYIVLAIAIVAESAAWYFAFQGFRAAKGDMGYFEAVREGKDPTLFVVLFEDSAALLGLVVALAGIAVAQATGNPLYDAVATVVIGLILGGVALWLGLETKSLLIGEAAHADTRRAIRDLAAESPEVAGVNELVALHMGPEHIIVTLSLDFRDELSAAQVEDTVSRLTRAIKDRHPTVKRVFIEAESREQHREQARTGTLGPQT
jgi:cation diffusion facilitator family transporter